MLRSSEMAGLQWVFLGLPVGLGLLPAWVCGCRAGTPPGAATGIIFFQVDDQVGAVSAATGAALSLGAIPGTAFPGPVAPDGRSLVVVSEQNLGEEAMQSLWRLPIDGGPAVDLGVSGSRVRKPAWFPDSSGLVFEWDKRSFSDIFRVAADGSGSTRLTAAEGGSFDPAVSPRGTHLAFASSRDGNAEIYVQGVGDGLVTRLSRHPGDDTHPIWLSAERLAWIGIRGGHAVLFAAEADGKGVQQLYPSAQPSSPASGPGVPKKDPPTREVIDVAVCTPASRIAIVTRSDAPDSPAGVDIILVEIGLNGTELGRIATPEQEDTPAWSPDCASVAYSRGNSPEVWLADFNGANARFLTKGWLPRWAPSPK